METKLQLEMLRQPDDTTCGPTCLHAVYRYYGLDLPLDEVIHAVPTLRGGGTLDVLLACDALRRGFRVTIYTYNLILFDPTWFKLGSAAMIEKLKLQAAHKRKQKLQLATQAYIEYLKMGGELRFEDLTTSLIRRYLKRDVPIITGLSATYLYGAMREIDETSQDDDIRGTPSGHFVILGGYDAATRMILLADPLRQNPLSSQPQYEIPIQHVISAIMLGIVTYDANLMIVRPPNG